jgi:hypothetical protein
VELLLSPPLCKAIYQFNVAATSYQKSATGVEERFRIFGRLDEQMFERCDLRRFFYSMGL